MARRPTRASTGRLIDMSVDTLSADLLGLEAGCKARLEAEWVALLPAVAREAKKLLSPGPVDGKPLASLAAQAAAAGLPHVRALVWEASDEALKAIQRELAAIERNLGMRYDGLARQATDATRALVAAQVETLVPTWVDSMAVSIVWFEDQMVEVARQAKKAKESPADMVRRLVAAESVGLPGQTGRGLWWKPFQSAYQAAKAAEFTLVNRVRQQAMYEFNEKGGMIGG